MLLIKEELVHGHYYYLVDLDMIGCMLPALPIFGLPYSAGSRGPVGHILTCTPKDSYKNLHLSMRLVAQ